MAAPLLPRAQRRRLAREAARSVLATGAAPRPAGPPTSLWWTCAFVLVFVFVCASFAMVRSLELWRGAPHLPGVIGWTGMALGVGAIGWLWGRRRDRMRWSGRLALAAVPAIGAGLILGLLWANGLERWHDNERFSALLTQAQGVVAATETWQPGQPWDAARCALVSSERDALVQSAFRGPQPPPARAVPLALGVDEVLYQAGCPHVDWDRLRNAVTHPPAAWSVDQPRHVEALLFVWNHVWPSSIAGCRMQRQRALALGRGQDAASLERICQVLGMVGNGTKPWDPQRFDFDPSPANRP